MTARVIAGKRLFGDSIKWVNDPARTQQIKKTKDLRRLLSPLMQTADMGIQRITERL